MEIGVTIFTVLTAGCLVYQQYVDCRFHSVIRRYFNLRPLGVKTLRYDLRRTAKYYRPAPRAILWYGEYSGEFTHCTSGCMARNTLKIAYHSTSKP